MPVDGPVRILMTGALVALLAACGSPPPSPAQIAARAATLKPGDTHVAELYDRSCKACHAEPRANAPLTGDRTAWRARIAKGRAALVQSVLTGVNGMPAGGQCFTCTPRDYEALISFMADEDAR